MKSAPHSFSGFSPKSIQFLNDVYLQNSKPWFGEHKNDYEAWLLNPFRQLVADLTPVMLSIDDAFEVRPAINRTISKIFRDTRFSRDKSIFKNTMWLTFKRPSKEWMDAPGYFFELTTTFYRYGMGYYQASCQSMELFREQIDQHADYFRDITAFQRENSPFKLETDPYKRQIPNDHGPEIQEWYQCKSFYLTCQRDFDEKLYSPTLVDEMIHGFLMTQRLYQFLIDIVLMKNALK